MHRKARREGEWTVCLIPDDPAQETVRFRLHRRLLSILLFVGTGLFGWSAFVTTHYVWLQRSYQRLVRVEDEYEQMKQDFIRVRQYSSRLQSDLERMEQQVRRLQIIAGATAGGNIPHIAGIGGESALTPQTVGRVHMLEQQWFLAQGRQRAEALQDQLNRLYEIFQQKSVALSATPSILPVRGYVISGFGARIDPFTGAPDFHTGVDIFAPYGTPVVATAAGQVVFVGLQGTYGQLIIVDHGFGIFTYYGHLSKTLVRKGDMVKRWQVIGLVGSTGRTTGPHVHYEVRYQNQPLNPLQFIVEVF
ncbi:MAG: M23 family metallopeptidase [Acidobacteria bacterium]|nr:M23 family metallopeptidase [Acidobacteriota bacterium]MDW7984177.1 M23 family metallopeptidase [Acidobacteriota bacterium]